MFDSYTDINGDTQVTHDIFGNVGHVARDTCTGHYTPYDQDNVPMVPTVNLDEAIHHVITSVHLEDIS